MTKELIALRDICKQYETLAGIQHVLKHLNLSIQTGEFVALMGPSGSGKSTLLNIIGCLDTPTSGQYFLDGNDISGLDYDRQALIRSQIIGFVFQGFNLLPRMSLAANVELPMVYAKIPAPERRQRTKELLDRVGLGDRLAALPNQISGGEQQRVTIARALANRPKLILADEPTGNLDVENGKSIMSIFSTLHQEGVTIFLVTHEADIATYAQRLIRLLDGNIISDEKCI